jgi:hypothetical protein
MGSIEFLMAGTRYCSTMNTISKFKNTCVKFGCTNKFPTFCTHSDYRLPPWEDEGGVQWEGHGTHRKVREAR